DHVEDFPALLVDRVDELLEAHPLALVVQIVVPGHDLHQRQVLGRERLEGPGRIPAGLEHQVRQDLARRPLAGLVRALEVRLHAFQLAREVRPRRIGLGLELAGDLAWHRPPPGIESEEVYAFAAERPAEDSALLSRQGTRRGTLHVVNRLRWLVLVLVFALAPWTFEPAVSQSRVETFVSGLEVPWALAFAPDGAIYLTERGGLIRVIKNGRLDPKAVATLPVAARGESGLMGLALGADFAKNGHL